MKYYKLNDIYYWADANTKITEGSIEITKAEFDASFIVEVPPQTQFTALEFLERFNETEQLAVVSATLANAQVKLWYDKMLAASFVDITDPRTIGGLDALVAFNLLTETRKDEILQA